MNFLTMLNKIMGFAFLFFTFPRGHSFGEIDDPLPVNPEPLNYELILLTHVERVIPNFEGCVHIMFVVCANPTNEVISDEKYLSMKTKGVRVWRATEDKAGGERITVLDHGQDVDNNSDRYTIKLKDSSTQNNNYEITIDFSKFRLPDASYIHIPYQDGKMHPDIEYIIVFKEMNEIDAKTIFPHLNNLDKVKFKIKIGHDFSVTPITNSELITTQPMYHPGWVMDEFAEIENPIPTFSIALAVEDFKFVEGEVEALGADRVESNIKIRVWAGENVLFHTKEILRVTSNIFLHYSKFFDVPYEPKKLDFVVLPDYRTDVLGYYGLIFLRQNEILKAFKRRTYKFSPVKYSVASKICHAISAQWIGLSATMSGWNDAWLQAGLNKYLEKSCVDNLFPSWWVSTEQNIINSFLELLKTEERGNFNPVLPVGNDFTFQKNSANDDTISKGDDMSTYVFQKSIKTYLEESKSQKMDSHKLWKIFNLTANEKEQILPEGVTVEQIMESWLGQRGHPLILVSRDLESNKIIVTQEPFDSSIKGESDDQPKCWIVPLRFRIRNEADESEKPRVRDWLKCDGKPLEIDVKNGDWILFNLNLHVPARVKYDHDNWILIEDMLKVKKQYSKIELSARIHLISDMFALAEAEKLTYQLVFNIMKYLTNEDSYFCWQLAYEEIMKIRFRWLGTKLLEPFQRYIRSIVRPIFDEEFKSIEEYVRSNRQSDLFENIVKIMCTFEDSECQEFGETRLENWYTNTKDDIRNLIPKGLVESIYCLAIRNADEKKWDFLYQLHEDSALDYGILKALGCSSDTELLRKFQVYGTLVTRGNIEPEFCLMVYNSLLKNNLGYPIVENFLQLGMKNLSIHLLRQGRVITLENILAKVYEATKTREHMERLDEAYSKIKTKVQDRAKLLEESKFKAEKNMAWLQEHEEPLLKYFEKSNVIIQSTTEN